LHHPPLPPRNLVHTRKMLRDHTAFHTAVARAGAELVLHGHSHRFGLGAIELRAGGYAPVLSVPSGSAIGSAEGAAAGWNLYRLQPDGPGAWRVEVTSRVLSPAADGFVTRGRFSLAPARKGQ
jgi:3',5'-cyclic AMP phosphodiesterase CpdA